MCPKPGFLTEFSGGISALLFQIRRKLTTSKLLVEVLLYKSLPLGVTKPTLAPSTSWFGKRCQRIGTAIRRLRWGADLGGYAVHPTTSYLWDLPELKLLASSAGLRLDYVYVACSGVQAYSVHNCGLDANWDATSYPLDDILLGTFICRGFTARQENDLDVYARA
eukprot:1037500-Amphidinium_carterae.1